MKMLVAYACLFLRRKSCWRKIIIGATQQARRDSAQNDAEQQRIAKEANGGAPAAAAGPAPAPAAPMNPGLAATLKNMWPACRADFASAVVATTTRTRPKSFALEQPHAGGAGNEGLPPSVKKLADDLTAAVTDKKKLAWPQQQKLAQDVHALFNSAHLTAAQQQKLPATCRKSSRTPMRRWMMP